MTSRHIVPKRRPGAATPAAATPGVSPPKLGPPSARRQPVKVRLRRWPRPRTLVWMALVFIGLTMFLAANLGARTGWITLPGDPHHARGQLLGMVIVFVGIGVASGVDT